MDDETMKREREILACQNAILDAMAPLEPLQRRAVIRAVLASFGWPVPVDAELVAQLGTRPKSNGGTES